MSITSVIAPLHVTILKNWGYSGNIQEIPHNDTIAVTINLRHICAKAAVIASTEFIENIIYINGKFESMANLKLARFINVLKLKSESGRLGECWLIKAFCSNNAIKDIGLDTQAAEYAAFVKALAAVYAFDCDVSDIMRLICPSACSSLHGGIIGSFVRPENFNYARRCAKPLIAAHHWPELHIIIIVIDPDSSSRDVPEKKFKSMYKSPYSKYRSTIVVPLRSMEMCKAIGARNFPKLAESIMKESNSMHANYMTAYPPLIFLNDTSRSVIELVHAYNDKIGRTVVGYTFEASPNPILFILEENIPLFISTFLLFFPLSEDADEFFLGCEPHDIGQRHPGQFLNSLNLRINLPGKIKNIMITSMSSGPEVVPDI